MNPTHLSAGSHRRSRTATIASLAAAGALLAGGCSAESLTERALETAVERASDGAVDIDSSSGQMTITDEDGTTATFGAGTEVPDAFSQLVEVPSGFQVAAVTELQEADGSVGYSVNGTVDDGSTHDDVVAAVEAALTGGGWELVDVGEGLHNVAPEMDTVMAERGDASVLVSILSDEEDVGPHMVGYVLIPQAS